MQKNYTQVRRFAESLTTATQFANHTVAFTATVTYEIAGRKPVSETAEVMITLSGYNPCVIYINRQGTDFFHNEFKPDWGEFKFVRNKGLVVKNRSMVYGQYTMTISETT